MKSNPRQCATQLSALTSEGVSADKLYLSFKSAALVRQEAALTRRWFLDDTGQCDFASALHLLSISSRETIPVSESSHLFPISFIDDARQLKRTLGTSRKAAAGERPSFIFYSEYYYVMNELEHVTLFSRLIHFITDSADRQDAFDPAATPICLIGHSAGRQSHPGLLRPGWDMQYFLCDRVALLEIFQNNIHNAPWPWLADFFPRELRDLADFKAAGGTPSSPTWLIRWIISRALSPGNRIAVVDITESFTPQTNASASPTVSPQSLYLSASCSSGVIWNAHWRLAIQDGMLLQNSGATEREEAMREGAVAEALRRSRASLASLHNVHSGQHCFVLGNGPSLNRMSNLSQLNSDDHVVLGANKIHLGFERFGFTCDYISMVNTLVIEQMNDIIPSLPASSRVLLLSRTLHELLPHLSPRVFSLRAIGGAHHFCRDLSLCEAIAEGGTVTFINLQLAFHLGCARVALIGVDHSFQQQGAPNDAKHMDGDDPNHFDPSYFANQTWHNADLVGSERSYRLAKKSFAAAGREIVDATLGGKLTIFPKSTFEAEIQWSKSRQKRKEEKEEEKEEKEQEQTQGQPKTKIEQTSYKNSTSSMKLHLIVQWLPEQYEPRKKSSDLFHALKDRQRLLALSSALEKNLAHPAVEKVHVFLRQKSSLAFDIQHLEGVLMLPLSRVLTFAGALLYANKVLAGKHVMILFNGDLWLSDAFSSVLREEHLIAPRLLSLSSNRDEESCAHVAAEGGNCVGENQCTAECYSKSHEAFVFKSPLRVSADTLNFSPYHSEADNVFLHELKKQGVILSNPCLSLPIYHSDCDGSFRRGLKPPLEKVHQQGRFHFEPPTELKERGEK